jgi:hypothetical protein
MVNAMMCYWDDARPNGGRQNGSFGLAGERVLMR